MASDMQNMVQLAMRKMTEDNIVDDLWTAHNQLLRDLRTEPDPYKCEDLLDKARFVNTELRERVKNLGVRYKLKLEMDRFISFERSLYGRKARVDITLKFITSLLKEMKDRYNEIIGVTGRTGVGKSYFSLALAKLLDPSFNVSRIAFTTQEFVQCIKNTKPKQFIVWDEIGVPMDARVSMAKERRPVYQMLETFRVLERNVIFTTPSVEFADKNIRRLYHYHLVMTDRGVAQAYEEGITSKEEKVLGRVKMFLPTKDLVYCKSCVLRDGDECSHDVDCYEKRKYPYIMELVERAIGGIPGATPPQPTIELQPLNLQPETTGVKSPAPAKLSEMPDVTIPKDVIEKLRKELEE